jgi:urocanate hydratase
MGGAQPLAITMNEGVALIAEVEEWRIDKRIETKYLDEKYTSIDEAINAAVHYRKEGIARSIGVVCNAVHLLDHLISRDIIPDTLTDQTSAHDPLIGYIPHTLSNAEANELRTNDPERYLQRSYESMYLHVQLMLQLMDQGAVAFDYGNNIRARAKEFEDRQAAVVKLLLPSQPLTTHHLPLTAFFPAAVSTSPASSPLTSVRSFAKAKALSVGQHSVAKPMILP